MSGGVFRVIPRLLGSLVVQPVLLHGDLWVSLDLYALETVEPTVSRRAATLELRNRQVIR